MEDEVPTSHEPGRQRDPSQKRRLPPKLRDCEVLRSGEVRGELVQGRYPALPRRRIQVDPDAEHTELHTELHNLRRLVGGQLAVRLFGGRKERTESRRLRTVRHLHRAAVRAA